MARQIGSAKAPAAPADAGAAASASELDIMAGELPAPVAGRNIVVREYGFFESARLLPAAKPLIDALQPIFASKEPPTVFTVVEVMLTLPDVVRHLVACAIVPAPAEVKDHAAEVSAEERWLDSLNDTDGESMLLLWWQANASFFLRRLVRNAAAAQASASATDASSTT